MKCTKELRLQLIDSRINILKARGEQMNQGIINKLLRERKRLTNG